MKITAIILFGCLLFLAAPARASDWTDADTNRQLVFYGLKAIDWKQTLSIKNNPNLQEGNPLLGPNPSDSRINNFMLGAMLLETGIAVYLNADQRAYFQYIMIGFTGLTIGHNWTAGTKWGF